MSLFATNLRARHERYRHELGLDDDRACTQCGYPESDSVGCGECRPGLVLGHEPCADCGHDAIDHDEPLAGIHYLTCEGCYDGAPDSDRSFVASGYSLAEALDEWDEHQREVRDESCDTIPAPPPEGCEVTR